MYRSKRHLLIPKKRRNYLPDTDKEEHEMGKKSQFLARDADPDAQAFLLMCAKGVAAADGNIVPEEKEWLIAQFGEDALQVVADQDIPLVPNRLLDACELLGDQLTREQQDHIYPQLRLWLLSLARVDSIFAVTERVVINLILRRLDAPLRPKIVASRELARMSAWRRRRMWFDEVPLLNAMHALLLLAVLFGILGWALRSKEPEAPIVYRYLEPALEEVEKSLLATIGKTAYRDVAVYREIPVMLPDEILQAGIARSLPSLDLTAVDLPWTVPDSELTYICTATSVRSNEKRCALLSLHKVPDTPAWFGTVDFGVGRPGRIVFVRTSWLPLPPVSEP
jgi:hypothetical protein